MRIRRSVEAVALIVAGLLATEPSAAQLQGAVPVVVEGTTVKLVTVTYKPARDGPFPTLIFHHGSGEFDVPSDPRTIAQWFVARGWAVIALSRRGRGGSQGVNEEGGHTCSAAAADEGLDHGLADLDAVTPVLLAQPFVDRRRIAVAGNSRGGVLSVAWSGKHPDLAAVINFVGGWTDTRTCQPGRAINLRLLKRGVASAQKSLWLYGDRDLFYPLEDTRANFDAFVAAGGKAEWRSYEAPFAGWTGHEIGLLPRLWSADMEAYLAGRGLSAAK